MSPLAIKELPRTLIITAIVLPCALIASAVLLITSPIQLMVAIVERRENPVSVVMRDVFWPVGDVINLYSKGRDQ